MMDDSRIVALFLARREQAIAEVEAKYAAACRNIARNILKNERDAEECVNDAYLAVWNTIPPERPDPLKAYIFRIVRNIAVAKYHANTAVKRNSYYDTALEELEECLTTGDTVEAEITARELTGRINCFLSDMDEESRMLFVRRYWYGDGVGALAERFGTSRNNVSVRLSRIREKLKKELQKEGYL